MVAAWRQQAQVKNNIFFIKNFNGENNEAQNRRCASRKIKSHVQWKSLFRAHVQ